ncbi:MAG: hypothetical protein ACE5EF_02325 [Dehalococcoidia bacterium]
MTSLITALGNRDGKPTAAPNEEAWHQAWTAQVAGTAEPLVLSALGGALADRLAWVFHAGYQGAIRHVFPSLASDRRFISYLVSEDRDGRLPAVTLSETGGGGGSLVVSGTKTWVAAAKTVGLLVVSAGWGEAQRFVLVPRDLPGVRVEPGSTASFLSAMSQGRAHFERVPIPAENALAGASQHAAFGAAEPLHVLTAINAFMFARARGWSGGESVARRAASHLVAAEALAGRPLGSAELAVALAGLDEETGLLAEEFEPLLAEHNPDALASWDTDRRIVSLYRRGTAARADAASDR